MISHLVIVHMFKIGYHNAHICVEMLKTNVVFWNVQDCVGPRGNYSHYPNRQALFIPGRVDKSIAL